jgi:hypothetical protein
MVVNDQKIRAQPDELRRVVRASLKSLLAFRRDQAAAIGFLAAHFEIPQSIAIKAYPNALDILTADGAISEEKLRQILAMMRDTGGKETIAVKPATLIDFSFLREAQKEFKQAGSSPAR